MPIDSKGREYKRGVSRSAKAKRDKLALEFGHEEQELDISEARISNLRIRTKGGDEQVSVFHPWFGNKWFYVDGTDLILKKYIPGVGVVVKYRMTNSLPEDTPDVSSNFETMDEVGDDRG